MPGVLVIADIEGSTGCLKTEDAKLFTGGWAKACFEMSLDIAEITNKLLNAGIDNIVVKDFHRTGHNIFTELIDKRVKVVSGYFDKPVLGIGKTYNTSLLVMTGMHVASGCCGFLPHTLTSRFAKITVNNKIVSEAELFASSVFHKKIAPVFFSGCKEACLQAKTAIDWLNTYSVNKPLDKPREAIRKELADGVLNAVNNKEKNCRPFMMHLGRFNVSVTLRDGKKAAVKLAKLWKLKFKDDTLFFVCNSFKEFYEKLTDIAYMHPILINHKKTALKIYNIWGKISLLWAKMRMRDSLKRYLK